ncbi:MAG: transglutaminase family protein [Bosea sp. (in: a-proteobacteria)]
MRIRISHEAAYTFEQPVRSVNAALRVMPRDHEGQVVVSWRIEPSVDGRLRSAEDAFGNLVHHFQAEGPFDALAIRIEGIVETTDTTGFVRAAADPMPAQVFLRDTALTQPDEAMVLYARKLDRAGKSGLEQLHLMMDALHTELKLEVLSTNAPAKASEAFGLRSGTAADLAHIFCGCARELGIPARIVVGYTAPDSIPSDAKTTSIGASHVWTEARIPDYGWIGFDPSLNLCPGAGHVRVAVGLDYADAAAFRQARVGGGGETSRNVVSVAAIAQ